MLHMRKKVEKPGDPDSSSQRPSPPGKVLSIKKRFKNLMIKKYSGGPFFAKKWAFRAKKGSLPNVIHDSST